MLEPGQVIDRYQVESLIGEGGMAAVFRVTHTVLGTSHALKLLAITHPSVTERLVHEGRVQGQLGHPNVVNVTDVVMWQGQPCLVMEFVDGVDLEGWLTDGTVHERDEAEAVFRGICSGVAAAHARGLVHRDLKPANVLMARDERGWVPKVADFGLAKVVESSGTGKTRAGMAMGTPAYMAPEQIRDAATVDARADIFSLGCILYALVCGEAAFQGRDVVSIWNRVCAGEYAPPRTIRGDLPERFVRAIDGALQVDADRRFGSVAELVAALDGARAPTPPAPPARKGLKTPGMLEWALAAALVVGVAGTLGVAGVGLATVAYMGSGEDEVETPVEGDVAQPAEGAGDEPEEAPNIPARDLPVCSPAGEPGTKVGYVRTGGTRLGERQVKRGQTWTAPAEMEVRADLGADDVVCRLLKGTEVEVIQSPTRIARSGVWVTLEAGSFRLPEP